MPKDPPRNQPRYKIGGYHINEYEFEHNKGRYTEEHTDLPKNKTAGKRTAEGETENEGTEPHTKRRPD